MSSHSTDSPIPSASQRKSLVMVQIIGSLFCIAAAGLQAYGNRANLFQNDAISYLDISDFVINGNWKEVINSNWSPLYPVVLAAFRMICGFHNIFEPTIVKIANFFIYLLQLGAFNFFVISFLEFTNKRKDNHLIRLPAELTACLLFIIFGWTSLTLSGLFNDTPDHLSFSCVITAAALTLRLFGPAGKRFEALALGVILALGYLAKAAVFPEALIFFALIFLSAKVNLKRRVQLVGIAVGSFLCISIPWIYLLSIKTGHFTLSDAAYCVYVSYVMRVSVGPRPEGPDFLHPARVICAIPHVLKFAKLDGGTYPLWTDPGYWNQGVVTRLTPRILEFAVINASVYMFLFGVPFCAYFVQFLIIRPMKFHLLSRIKSTWNLWLPPLAGLTMYLLTFPMMLIGTSRYISGYIFLLFAAVLASVRIERSAKGRVAMVLTMACLCLMPSLDILRELQTDVSLAMKTPSYRDMHIAEELLKLGIMPGSRIAVIGCEELEGRYRFAPLAPPLRMVPQAWYYWARAAHLQIVAQILNSNPKVSLAAEIATLDRLKSPG